MNIFLRFSLFVLFSVYANAISAQAPVANFTVNQTTGCAPLCVTFTSTSTGGPTSYSWNFGDNTSSVLQKKVALLQKVY